MPRTKKQGHFQFCVDLGMNQNRSGLAEHRAMAAFVNEMANLFLKYGVPATWAIPNFPTTQILPSAIAQHRDHEIALLATNDWAGPQCRREDVLRHLQSFFQSCERLGSSVESVAIRNVDIEPYADLLRKYGVRALREQPTCAITKRAIRDQTAPRVAMWRIAPTCVFSSTSGLWNRFDRGFAAKKIMRRALIKKSTEHLVVSAADIIGSRSAPQLLKSLSSVIETVSKLTANGRLKAESLRDATQRLQPVNSQPPQHSVLRPAA